MLAEFVVFKLKINLKKKKKKIESVRIDNWN